MTAKPKPTKPTKAAEKIAAQVGRYVAYFFMAKGHFPKVVALTPIQIAELGLGHGDPLQVYSKDHGFVWIEVESTGATS